MTMLHSLLVKLGMLIAAIGLVLWIGWRAPDASSDPVAPVNGIVTGVTHRPEAVKPDADRVTGLGAQPVAAESRVIAAENRGSGVNGLLDVNRAGAREFESLPGIGPVLAQRVIEYRTTVGRFQTIDDLRAVKGIGPKIFERIKPLVMVATVEVKRKTEKRL